MAQTRRDETQRQPEIRTLDGADRLGKDGDLDLDSGLDRHARDRLDGLSGACGVSENVSDDDALVRSIRRLWILSS